MTSAEERLAVLEQRAEGNDHAHTAIERNLDDIRVSLKDLSKALLGRPSWSVTTLLTILSSLCVGLGVALATAR